MCATCALYLSGPNRYNNLPNISISTRFLCKICMITYYRSQNIFFPWLVIRASLSFFERGVFPKLVFTFNHTFLGLISFATMNIRHRRLQTGWVDRGLRRGLEEYSRRGVKWHCTYPDKVCQEQCSSSASGIDTVWQNNFHFLSNTRFNPIGPTHNLENAVNKV